MKKTVYIHIGTFKTGTTSIQYYCDYNREALQANGVFYPRYFRINTLNPMNGAIFLRTPSIEQQVQDLEEIVNEFKNNNCKYMVFSEEELSRPQLHNFLDERISKLLSEFDVKIVVYFRHAAAFCASFWQELSKSRYLDSPKSCEEYMQNSKFLLDIVNNVYSIANIFGKENVIVKTYEKEAWVNNNLLDDFLSIFNLSIADVLSAGGKTLPNKNIGLSRERVDISNFINRFVPVNYGENHYNIHNFLNVLLKNQTETKVLGSISDELIKEVSDKYYEKECKIAKDFLGRDELFINKYPKPYGVKRKPYNRGQLIVQNHKNYKAIYDFINLITQQGYGNDLKSYAYFIDEAGRLSYYTKLIKYTRLKKLQNYIKKRIKLIYSFLVRAIAVLGVTRRNRKVIRDRLL